MDELALRCTPLQKKMSYRFGACGDSYCSRALVFCSNSYIICVVMVVGPRRPVSLTWVMMLPQRWETRRLMDRSRCPLPLCSPKRTHVWNWFCHHYLHVGPSLPPFSLSLTTVYKIHLIIKTQNTHVLMRSLSNNRLMLSVYAVILPLYMCVWLTELPMAGWGFAVFSHTCCSGWQTDS